jgi:acetyl-CoA synthetase
MAESALDALLQENRRFDPPEELARQANAQPELYDEAATDRLAFWEKQAEWLRWESRWSSVLEWDPPFAKWFSGGRLNACANAVDRHVEAGFGDKVASTGSATATGSPRTSPTPTCCARCRRRPTR